MRRRMTNQPNRSGAKRSSRGARTRSFASLAATVEALPVSLGHTRLVAIDGPGGSGKSTFAARLAAALGECPVVHTDDLAGRDTFFGWYPRFAAGVLEPLSRGDAGRFRRYDWLTRSLAEEIAVPAAPVVIVEGVGAARREIAPSLTFAVWLDTPSDVRLARGISRDGEGLRDFWELWRRGEDAHYATDATRERADLVVDGDPAVPHDPAVEFVTLDS